MLIKMRSAVAKILVFSLFGLLILSFAVWGIGETYLGVGHSTTVAEVGDRAIDQHEFSRDLNIEMARLGQQLNRRLTLEQAAAFGVVDQVLQRLVTRALFDQQAVEMGLVVSDDQLRRQISQDPTFQNSQGVFDPARFEQILRNQSMNEPQYLAALRRDIQRRQLLGSMAGAGTAPRAVAEAIHAHRGEQRGAEALRIPLDQVAQPEDPDEATLQTFYEAESSTFMAPETRAVAYLQLGLADVESEIQISEEEAREVFEERPEDFLNPERRQVSQLVFGDQAAAEAAHASIGEGIAFEAAGEASQSGQPVPLGRLTRQELARLLPELAEPAFALEANGTSAPVETTFGWHLLHVSEIEAGDEPSFEALRDKVIGTLKQEQSIETIVSIANQMDDQLARGSTLEEISDSLALGLREIPAVDASGNDGDGSRIEDLPQRGLFLRTLFETEEGETSLILGDESEGYFVLRVDGTTPTALRPLDEVRNEAIALWKTEERLRLAEARASELAERAKGGESLAEIAEAEGLTVATIGPITRLDSDPANGATRQVVERLFELADGEVAAARGDDGGVVLKLTGVTPVATGGDGDGVARIREQLAGVIQQDLVAAFSQTLHESHDVTVNQPLIEEMITGIPRY